jgi:opacity protein-like surface antigen
MALLFVSAGVQAQETKWGIGGFVDFNIPFLQLRERFSNTPKYGATLNFVRSKAVTIEIEYHYSRFGDGKPGAEPFTWSVDGKTYTSPNAESSLTFNSVTINALIFLGEENRSRGFAAKEYRFYVLVGGGFYRYKMVNKDLVFPGQTSLPIDLTLVMDPQVDQRYTLGADFGVGLEAFVTDNLSFDLRGRYNFVVGELRPMLFYEQDRTRPLQLVDFGVGMKFYFWQ